MIPVASLADRLDEQADTVERLNRTTATTLRFCAQELRESLNRLDASPDAQPEATPDATGVPK